ncbi:MAG TPA: spore coat U domain-containing protein [Vicinamibacterales bacterium]
MSARIVLVAAVLLGALIGDAYADCSVSVGSLSFGAYDVFDASPTDSTGTISYMCGPRDKDIRITISTGSSGTYATRELRNGPERLAYNLYRDGAFTQVWGDGSGGTSFFFIKNPQPNNVWLDLTVFARLPPGQDVAAGTYSDTVIVTVEY